MSTSRIPAILVAVAGVLTLASAAAACGGGGGGYGGGFGGGSYRGGSCNYNNGGYNNYNNSTNYSRLGQAYEPFHSSYFVQPGDTFYEVSLKEYGTSAAMSYIARYNRLSTTKALTPGQQLLLPSISASGRLARSNAPAAESFAKSTLPILTKSTAKAAPVAAVAETISAPEPERTSVPTGSTLQLDGESLGSETGVVRLRVSGVAFPVEVVKWSDESTQVRLPKLDVGSATKADLEVVRADGTLAATNPIELVAPATGLAAN
jgi:LysM domain